MCRGRCGCFGFCFYGKRVRWLVIKQNKRNIDKRFFYPAAAFLAVILILQGLCAVKGIYPYGAQSILQIDLYHQYAPFHEELRNRLLSGQSLLYSWEGGLGKVFYTQMAYYTISPLSFLYLLFPTQRLPDFMLLLVEIKLAFAAFLFSDYLQEHFQKRSPYSVIWGLLYAFCGFNVAFYWNVMWLDVVALFPLLALSVDGVIEKRDGRRYIWVLALTIVCNFYLAFITCIGIVLYFGVRLLSRYQIRTQWKEMLGCAGRFALTSLLGGGIAMFLLIPVAIGLSQTSAGSAGMNDALVYGNIWQILESPFLGAKPQVLVANDDPPNIYAGVLPLLTLPFFFADKKVSRKERVLWGCVLAFLLLCCVLSPLDYLIHGAHYPANMPHRFSFIYCFFVLALSYRGFLAPQGCKWARLLAAAGVWMAVLLVSEFVIVPSMRELQRLYTDQELIANGVLLAGYLLLLLLIWANPKRSAVVFALLLCVTAGECLYAGINGFEKQSDRAEYTANLETMDKVIDYMDSREDGGFYRAEFRRFTTTNDGALYHYHGAGIFSSLLPGSTADLAEALGLAAHSTSFRYYDPPPLIGSLFNVKYVMEKTGDGNGGMQNPFYQYLHTEGNIEIYENPGALGMGFLADESVKNWKVLDSTPFQVQNDFAVKAAGLEEAMFTNVPAATLAPENISINAQQAPSRFSFRVPDPYDLEKVPAITIVFPVEEDGYYFLWAAGDGANRLMYRYGNMLQDREMSASNGLIDLGWLPGGAELAVQLRLADIICEKNKYVDGGDVSFFLAAYRQEVFQEMHGVLSASTWQLTGWGDTWLEGDIDADREGVMIVSVPNEKGWRAFVDGAEMEITGVGADSLIGLELAQGRHTVRLEFHLPGLAAGIALSALSLCGAAAYHLALKRRRRRESPVEPAQPVETGTPLACSEAK